MEQEEAEEAAFRYFEYFTHPMQKWLDSLPPMLMQNNIRTALRSIHNAGYLFVKIDRSPGRLMLMCRHAWLFLQQSAFLQSPRYTFLESAETDENYRERVFESLKSVLRDCGSKLPLRKMKGTGRPYGYWTVKNKSLLFSVPPLVKFRPIISHWVHPGRPLLRKVARALAILVDLASAAVRGAKSHHVPMWRLHEGSRKWIEELLRARRGGVCRVRC